MMKRSVGKSGDEPEEKRKMPNEDYSSSSKRIMASMGYVPGKGIGKYGTGIAEPIQESSHKGRQGLGFFIEGLEREDVEWEFEEVQCNQKPEWLSPCKKPQLTIEDLTGWISIGSRKLSIADETSYCDPVILDNILEAKSIFDSLSEKEFLDARLRSNPFESIKNVIFQNRAAMKMANIDAVFDYMFTDSKWNLGPCDLLYFADLCSGPGGFSEYILWKKKWQAKGFGFTLKDPESGSDFKLDEFLAAPCESFDPHYGLGGYDGDGDITKPENIDEFRKYILHCTGDKGVHFVMADGGISVEGQENIQEILTKQLVLCQYLCALSVLCKGGHFVCKVFDMFTPFSVGLFYILYRCFQQVCIFKPVTSRPANSERYIVCQNFIHGNVVTEYLCAINEQLIKFKKVKDQDVISVVPKSIIDEETEFASYIISYNNRFGTDQLKYLEKLQYFVKNPKLIDKRQTEIRRKCLDLWKIPNIPRTSKPEITPLQIFKTCWNSEMQYKFLQSKFFIEVTVDSLDFMSNIHSWKWCWASGKRCIVVSLGRNELYVWDISSDKPHFVAKRDLYGLELPKGTVLELELVQEYIGEGTSQRKFSAAHIIDVIAVFDETVFNKTFKERLQFGEKLCKAINKPCRKEATIMRTKEIYRLSELEKTFSKLKLRSCKGNPKSIQTIQVSSESFFIPIGILIFKITKDPWNIHLSRHEQKFYYFNSKTRQSTFDCPLESVASYSDVLCQRHIWKWNKSISQNLCLDNVENNELNKTKLISYIKKLLEK